MYHTLVTVSSWTTLHFRGRPVWTELIGTVVFIMTSVKWQKFVLEAIAPGQPQLLERILTCIYIAVYNNMHLLLLSISLHFALAPNCGRRNQGVSTRS